MDLRERREAGKKALLTRAVEAALVVFILLMILGLLTPPARLPLVSPVPLTPLAGERLKIGETKEVAWEILLVPHAADWGCTRKVAEPRPVVIELSRDGGGSWEEIADLSDERTFTYPWKVTGPASAGCILTITDPATGGRVASGLFEIVGPPPRQRSRAP